MEMTGDDGRWDANERGNAKWWGNDAAHLQELPWSHWVDKHEKKEVVKIPKYTKQEGV